MPDEHYTLLILYCWCSQWFLLIWLMISNPKCKWKASVNTKTKHTHTHTHVHPHTSTHIQQIRDQSSRQIYKTLQRTFKKYCCINVYAALSMSGTRGRRAWPSSASPLEVNGCLWIWQTVLWTHFCEGDIVITLNGWRRKSALLSEAQQTWQVHSGSRWLWI